jgi:8-amino-7-oxononanoate synthase
VSAEQLRGWMVARLAAALQIPPEAIDVDAPFVEHGLDSIAALQLTGALEEVLNRSLSATLIFDYPTIETLARHLAS